VVSIKKERLSAMTRNWSDDSRQIISNAEFGMSKSEEKMQNVAWSLWGQSPERIAERKNPSIFAFFSPIP
jgi:hypothetical protein